MIKTKQGSSDQRLNFARCDSHHNANRDSSIWSKRNKIKIPELRSNRWGIQMASYSAVHLRKSDGYFYWCRGRAHWGTLPLNAGHFILILADDVLHFPLIWSLTLYFPFLFIFLILWVYKKWFPQRERTQTGTGRFIALAVGHLISAQKVMKSLKWPKQFKFVRLFHIPEKLHFVLQGGITCKHLGWEGN